MRWTATWVVCSVLAAGLLTGCTMTQKGAAIGGAVGAGAGAFWANQMPSAAIDGPYTGAGVGLAAGGLAGALIGDALDETKNKDREDDLSTKVGALQGELAGKDKTVGDLQGELDRLKAELAKKPEVVKDVLVEVKDGQIRFTILNEVLFDAGKAELREDGLNTLNEVLDLVKKDFPDRRLMVEGHTDNDPIKASGWKSNWELSAARSLAVVHYMMDKKDVAGDKVEASACGEFRPVSPNDTAANKKLNRRAVIVVMPPQSDIVVDRK